jgi:hypothetical protein
LLYFSPPDRQQIQRLPVGFPEQPNREFSNALQGKFHKQQGFVPRGSVILGHQRRRSNVHEVPKPKYAPATWPLVRKSALPPDKLMIPFAHHKIPAASRSIGQYTNFSRTTLSFDHS